MRTRSSRWDLPTGITGMEAAASSALQAMRRPAPYPRLNAAGRRRGGLERARVMRQARVLAMLDPPWPAPGRWLDSPQPPRRCLICRGARHNGDCSERALERRASLDAASQLRGRYRTMSEAPRSCLKAGCGSPLALERMASGLPGLSLACRSCGARLYIAAEVAAAIVRA